jgi:hypothetical protein
VNKTENASIGLSPKGPKIRLFGNITNGEKKILLKQVQSQGAHNRNFCRERKSEGELKLAKRRLRRHLSLEADKRLSKTQKLCPLNTAYENAPKKRPFGPRALNLYRTEQLESFASGTRHDTPLESREYTH